MIDEDDKFWKLLENIVRLAFVIIALGALIFLAIKGHSL